TGASKAAAGGRGSRSPGLRRAGSRVLSARRSDPGDKGSIPGDRGVLRQASCAIVCSVTIFERWLHHEHAWIRGRSVSSRCVSLAGPAWPWVDPRNDRNDLVQGRLLLGLRLVQIWWRTGVGL